MDDYSLRQLVATVFRHWSVAAALFLSTVAAVAVFTFARTPIYESTSLLLVKFGREFIYRPPVGDGEAYVYRDRDSVINAELHVLGSRDVIDAVLESLGREVLYPDVPRDGSVPKGAFAQAFRADLSVTAMPDADVIRVGFRHADPGLAAAAVNLVVERFTDKHLEIFGGSEPVSFLERQVAAASERLARSEEALRGFRAAHRGFSSREPGELVLAERASLMEARRKVDNEIAGLGQRLSFLEGEGDRRDLGREIVEARADLRSHRAQRASLEAQLAELDAESAELPRLLVEYRILERERDRDEASYQATVERLDDARVGEEMDREKLANIAVIQRAEVPFKPIRPRKALELAIGAFLGSGLGVAGALAAEALGRRPSPH